MMGDQKEEELISRRTWLTMQALATRDSAGGWVSWFVAREAVASVAIEHPEWDMDEQRTFDEWAAS